VGELNKFWFLDLCAFKFITLLIASAKVFRNYMAHTIKHTDPYVASQTYGCKQSYNTTERNSNIE